MSNTQTNIFKLTDYDEDQAFFESFNDHIHIRTERLGDTEDGVVCSIDKPAAAKLIRWLQQTIGPAAYYSTPTLVETEE